MGRKCGKGGKWATVRRSLRVDRRAGGRPEIGKRLHAQCARPHENEAAGRGSGEEMGQGAVGPFKVLPSFPGSLGLSISAEPRRGGLAFQPFFARCFAGYRRALGCRMFAMIAFPGEVHRGLRASGLSFFLQANYTPLWPGGYGTNQTCAAKSCYHKKISTSIRSPFASAPLPSHRPQAAPGLGCAPGDEGPAAGGGERSAKGLR